MGCRSSQGIFSSKPRTYIYVTYQSSHSHRFLGEGFGDAKSAGTLSTLVVYAFWLSGMIEENRQFVPDESVEFEK